MKDSAYRVTLTSGSGLSLMGASVAVNALNGWHVDVKYERDWLYLRPQPPNEDALQDVALADMLWSFADQFAAVRLIVDLDAFPRLSSYLVGQLMLLHKRACLNKGQMRLCGISRNDYQVIEALRLVDRFPYYANRQDAEQGFVQTDPST